MHPGSQRAVSATMHGPWTVLGMPAFAGYVRLSADHEDATSITQQRQDVQAHADRLEVAVEWYADNDASASQYARRRPPEFERMLRDAQAGRLAGIIAYRFDRITRRPKDLERLIDIAERVPVIVLTMPHLQLTTPEGRFVARQLVSVAAMEADNTSIRVRRKHDHLAQIGVSHGGKAPYGYRRVPGRNELEVNETEAATVREIATGILDGTMSVSEAARRTGLSRTGVRTTLTSATVQGKRTHAGVDVPAQWPRILDEATVARLRASFAEKRHPGGSHVYLLRGLLTCSECGKNLIGKPRSRARGGTEPAYQCQTKGCQAVSRDAARLEAAAHEWLVAELGRAGAVAWAMGDDDDKKALLRRAGYQQTVQPKKKRRQASASST